MATVETIYSFNLASRRFGETMFEFLHSDRICSWYRHERDGTDRYMSVGRCSAEELAQELDRAEPELAIPELCRAGDALDRVQTGLLASCPRDPEDWSDGDQRRAQRAMQLRRARLALLDEAVRLCARQAAELAGRDPDAAELLITLRGSVREMIRRDYPERRGIPARLEHRLHA